MTEPLHFLLLGLASGAVYAALGISLVTVYKGTGVLNIAVGAMAAFPAFVYDELRRTGDLVLPLGPLGRIPTGGPRGTLVSLALALAVAALLGALIYLLVFKPLRGAPPLVRIVASVGVMLVLQALILVQFGSQTRSVAPLLPSGPVSVVGTTVPSDRIWLAVVVTLMTILLAAALRWTRIGLALRAAAESEKGAVLIGLSPDRLAITAWTVGSVVAALFAILVAPVTGLNGAILTLLVVPALAAALLGGLQRLGMTLGAGLAIGILQAEMSWLQTLAWYPEWARTGVKEGLPFLVIVVVLFVAGDRIPSRGTMLARRLPAAPEARHPGRTALIAGVAAIGVLALLPGGYRFAMMTSLAMALLALSLVVLTGFVGQVSLAQAAFAGIAGFTLSRLATDLGIGFPTAPILAALAAGAIGLIAGLPALRIRGDHLAIATLAAAMAAEQFLFKNPALVGGMGGNPVPNPTIGGVDLGVRLDGEFPRMAFAVLLVVVLAGAGWAVANLRSSRTGQRMLAVRSNERAAAAVGIDVARTKLTAFVISALIAGLGGAMLGYLRGTLSVESFSVFVSLQLLALAYLGGITTVSGAIVAGMLAPGGLLFVVVDRNIALGQYYLLLSGVGLVVTAILNPEGIVAAVRSVCSRGKMSSEEQPREEAKQIASTGPR